MAKAVAIVSALCMLALAIVPPCQAKFEIFDIVGSVYCDPCHVGFKTRLSKNIQDAIVRLECTNIDNGTVTFSVESKTDAEGKYSLHVEGDHGNDICQVSAISSPMQNCNEIMDSKLEKARIECADNTGIADPVRYANPLAFVSQEPAPECEQVLEELGLNANGTVLFN